jgi:hypothetical protein
MHGAYDNIEHMLAENREFAAKLAHLEEQLIIVFGPQWPAKLDAVAARKRAAAKSSPLHEQDGARLLKHSSAKHESSQQRKGRSL